MVSDRWMDAYREKKEVTRCPFDVGSYFTEDKIAGHKMFRIDIGTCSVPSGKMLVRDPMMYLTDPHEKPYMETCPCGDAPADIAVVRTSRKSELYAAVRLRFTDKPAVSYYEALVGYEDIYKISLGEYFGFNSESGLACICDEEAHVAFCEWFDEMSEDDDFELYSDVFEGLFRESKLKNPDHQSPSGDWIRWTIPNTDLSVIIVQTGYGEGAYPVYWGYDSNNQICQLIAQFIDIESI